MKRIAVFASHGGSNLQAIIDTCEKQSIDGEVCLVISNNSASRALDRARAKDIPAYHISDSKHEGYESAEMMMLQLLEVHQSDILFLAGYLKPLKESIVKKYYDNIYNIHPALIPNHCGKGMFGIHIHEAVIAHHEKETGITIHKVNENYDEGEIVSQCIVKVCANDTPESLQKRVMEREHCFIIETLQEIIKKETE